MTSNIGSAKLTSGRGKEKEGEAVNAVKAFFPPEFLNRLDEVIVFVSKSILPLMLPWLNWYDRTLYRRKL